MVVSLIRFASQGDLFALRAEVALHKFVIAGEPDAIAHVACRGAGNQYVEPVAPNHLDCTLDCGSDANVE
jgi:hypothetical protein